MYPRWTARWQPARISQRTAGLVIPADLMLPEAKTVRRFAARAVRRANLMLTARTDDMDRAGPGKRQDDYVCAGAPIGCCWRASAPLRHS
jgi:hypothetical protein